MCSVGFLILHCVGHRKIGKLPPTSVVAYFFVLLLFYPIVPIVCCAYSFVTARKVHIAMLAKLFEGFLDDGPQYVTSLLHKCTEKGEKLSGSRVQLARQTAWLAAALAAA